MTRRITPFAFLALAVAYGWMASRIELDPWSAAEALNARTLPFIYAVLLGLLCLPLLARGMQAQGDRVADSHGRRDWRGWCTAGLIAAAVVAFGLLIPLAGLWPSTFLLLAASLLATGERRWLVVLGAPAGLAALGWLVVEKLLGVYLDPGIWFD